MKPILTGFLITLAASTEAMPASALPGQLVGDVLLWSRGHALISPLGFAIKLQSDEPDLNSVSKCKGAQLGFSVWAEVVSQPWCDQRGCLTAPGAKVRQELLDYRHSRDDLKFERDNSAGLDLIQQVYGPSIATDFQTSKFVYRGDRGYPLHFYQGKRYGYTSTSYVSGRSQEDPKEYVTQLKLVPLTLLNREIQGQKLFEKNQPPPLP